MCLSSGSGRKKKARRSTQSTSKKSSELENHRQIEKTLEIWIQYFKAFYDKAKELRFSINYAKRIFIILGPVCG